MIENIFKTDFFLTFKSFLLGGLVGAIFAFFKFKPPAPETISGLFGIIGIFLGWWVISHFLS
ncbi:MAG: hypothetical protein CMF96_05940 [Candidatus Marinimicrobia bacterium]|nr:hypothetical protein [Candidatus Neomarinimicrobiota bacterium]|tara:strand:+ start:1997 stop:2182 length:186 start_codon:yes stop_codon:yes gene_type:complete